MQQYRVALKQLKLHAMSILQDTSPLAAPFEPQPKLLTEREQDVLYWLSHGKSSTEIGDILGISPNTVHVHSQNIAHKLQAKNRAHAVALALRTGVIGL